MDNYIECYVLYCTEDKTYLSDMSFWDEDVIKATKYKDLKRAREVKTHYDDTVKIMKISIAVHGTIVV